MVLSWLKKRLGYGAKAAKRKGPAKRCRLGCEALEDRCLPAAPVFNPLDPAFTLLPIGSSATAKKSLIVPISVASASGALTYTVTSITNASGVADPHVTAVQRAPFTFLELNVAGFANPMIFELFNDIAPDTAFRIAGLVQAGFYDGLIFHRVIKNFMIQGGDPLGTGFGGADHPFADEFNTSAIFSGKGQLAMANSGSDTNGSQFFVTMGPERHLDFVHTIFGQLVRGFDTLTAINNIATPAEVQTVTLTSGSTGGTFTLSFNGQTTAAISRTATAAQVQSALQALSTIGANDVAVTSSTVSGTTTFTLKFENALAQTNLSQVTADGANLTGPSPVGSITTATTTDGSDRPASPPVITKAQLIGDPFDAVFTVSADNGFTGTDTIKVKADDGHGGVATMTFHVTAVNENEVQTVTVSAGSTGGTYTLSFNGQTTTALANNATATQVQAALQALSTIGANNVSVTSSTVSGATTFTLNFQNALANTNLSQVTADGTSLTGTGHSVTTATTTQGVNEPPFLGTIPDQVTPVNTPASVSLSNFLFDLEGDSVSVGVSVNPSNAGVASPGGTITFTPSSANGGYSGPADVTVSVQEGSGRLDHQTFTIGVGDQALTASSPQPTPTADAQVAFTGPVATFGDADPAATPANYTSITINWGDGQPPSSGTISPVNEVQTVTLSAGSTGGTFTLTFNGQTTSALAFNSTAADVQAALEALSTIGTGNVAVTSSTVSGATTFRLNFQNALANTDVSQVTADGLTETGTGTITTSSTGTAVTGTNTLFTTELAVGERLFVGGVLEGTIQTITDNTHLTLTANAATTATNQPFTFSTGHSVTTATTTSGGFTVSGTHTYAHRGLYPIHVDVKDSGGAIVHTFTTASVNPTVTFSSATSSANDSAGTGQVQVKLSDPVSTQVTVHYDITAGTAVANSDFTPASSRTLTFAAFQTVANIPVTILNDGFAGPPETVHITLSGPSANVHLGPTTANTLSIQNTVALPKVSFSVAAASGPESGSPALLRVTLSNKSEFTVTVNYAVAAGGTAIDGTDFSLPAAPHTLTFLPGQTVQVIPVTIIDDTLAENSETIKVTLSGPTNAAFVGNIQPVETYTILDTDPAPTVNFDATSSTANEGGATSISVSLSAAAGRTITVPYTITGITATVGKDFTVTSGTLTFAPGVTNQSIIFPILTDTTYDPNETLKVTLGTVTGAVKGSNNTCVLTITDMTGQPSVGFSATAVNASEGTTAILTVTLSGTSALTTSVDYLVNAGGTATGGNDYTLVNGTLTFTPGQTSKTISVPIVNDTRMEGDETFQVALANPVNATLGVNSAETVTIPANDATGSADNPPPTVGFDATSSVAAEGTSATIGVSLSAPAASTVTVTYTITGITAKAGATGDFLGTTGTLTFAPGNTTPNSPLTIPINSDAVFDPNETLKITLGTVTGAGAIKGSNQTHVLTITDTTGVPSVGFTATTVNAAEGTTVNLVVQLLGATSVTTSVDYFVTGITNPGAATGGGVDYTLSNGTLTFLAGQTSKTIAVPIVNDAFNEADENFQVTLTNPINATVGANSAETVTILANDPLPTVSFSVTTPSDRESAAIVILIVTLSSPSEQTVSVQYQVDPLNPGTATNGDYSLSSGTLTFAPHQTTAYISLSLIYNPTAVTPNKTVGIALFNPVDAVLGINKAVLFTILDDHVQQ